MSDIDAKDLTRLSRLEGNPVLVVGNRVYDASSILPSVVHFTRQQYLFLSTYRLGVPLEEAADKAGFSIEEAESFLSRPKTVAWLEDRALKDHIRNEWAEGGKWWQVGEECLDGKRHLSKDQQIVFQAFGDRVCPKPRVGGDDEKGKTVINFNFSAKDVKEALAREESIEAEIG